LDAPLAVSGVVSALAALGALFFAWKTVRETTEARREERRARELERLEETAELVGETGDAAIRGMQGSSIHVISVFPIAQVRLAAALAARSADLPRTRAVVALTRTEVQTEKTADEVAQLTLAALDEIRDEIERRKVPQQGANASSTSRRRFP
jgi:hypothetical protein